MERSRESRIKELRLVPDEKSKLPKAKIEYYGVEHDLKSLFDELCTGSILSSTSKYNLLKGICTKLKIPLPVITKVDTYGTPFVVPPTLEDMCIEIDAFITGNELRKVAADMISDIINVILSFLDVKDLEDFQTKPIFQEWNRIDQSQQQSVTKDNFIQLLINLVARNHYLRQRDEANDLIQFILSQKNIGLYVRSLSHIIRHVTILPFNHDVETFIDEYNEINPASFIEKGEIPTPEYNYEIIDERIWIFASRVHRDAIAKMNEELAEHITIDAAWLIEEWLTEKLAKYIAMDKGTLIQEFGKIDLPSPILASILKSLQEIVGIILLTNILQSNEFNEEDIDTFLELCKSPLIHDLSFPIPIDGLLKDWQTRVEDHEYTSLDGVMSQFDIVSGITEIRMPKRKPTCDILSIFSFLIRNHVNQDFDIDLGPTFTTNVFNIYITLLQKHCRFFNCFPHPFLRFKLSPKFLSKLLKLFVSAIRENNSLNDWIGLGALSNQLLPEIKLWTGMNFIVGKDVTKIINDSGTFMLYCCSKLLERSNENKYHIIIIWYLMILGADFKRPSSDYRITAIEILGYNDVSDENSIKLPLSLANSDRLYTFTSKESIGIIIQTIIQTIFESTSREENTSIDPAFRYLVRFTRSSRTGPLANIFCHNENLIEPILKTISKQLGPEITLTLNSLEGIILYQMVQRIAYFLQLRRELEIDDPLKGMRKSLIGMNPDVDSILTSAWNYDSTQTPKAIKKLINYVLHKYYPDLSLKFSFMAALAMIGEQTIFLDFLKNEINKQNLESNNWNKKIWSSHYKRLVNPFCILIQNLSSSSSLFTDEDIPLLLDFGFYLDDSNEENIFHFFVDNFKSRIEQFKTKGDQPTRRLITSVFNIPKIVTEIQFMKSLIDSCSKTIDLSKYVTQQTTVPRRKPILFELLNICPYVLTMTELHKYLYGFPYGIDENGRKTTLFREILYDSSNDEDDDKIYSKDILIHKKAYSDLILNIFAYYIDDKDRIHYLEDDGISILHLLNNQCIDLALKVINIPRMIGTSSNVPYPEYTLSPSTGQDFSIPVLFWFVYMVLPLFALLKPNEISADGKILNNVFKSMLQSKTKDPFRSSLQIKQVNPYGFHQGISIMGWMVKNLVGNNLETIYSKVFVIETNNPKTEFKRKLGVIRKMIVTSVLFPILVTLDVDKCIANNIIHDDDASSNEWPICKIMYLLGSNMDPMQNDFRLDNVQKKDFYVRLMNVFHEDNTVNTLLYYYCKAKFQFLESMSKTIRLNTYTTQMHDLAMRSLSRIDDDMYQSQLMNICTTFRSIIAKNVGGSRNLLILALMYSQQDLVNGIIKSKDSSLTIDNMVYYSDDGQLSFPTALMLGEVMQDSFVELFMKFLRFVDYNVEYPKGRTFFHQLELKKGKIEWKNTCWELLTNMLFDDNGDKRPDNDYGYFRALLNLEDDDGKTLLFYALNNGTFSAVDFLMKFEFSNFGKYGYENLRNLFRILNPTRLDEEYLQKILPIVKGILQQLDLASLNRDGIENIMKAMITIVSSWLPRLDPTRYEKEYKILQYIAKWVERIGIQVEIETQREQQEERSNDQAAKKRK